VRAPDALGAAAPLPARLSEGQRDVRPGVRHRFALHPWSAPLVRANSREDSRLSPATVIEFARRLRDDGKHIASSERMNTAPWLLGAPRNPMHGFPKTGIAAELTDFAHVATGQTKRASLPHLRPFVRWYRTGCRSPASRRRFFSEEAPPGQGMREGNISFDDGPTGCNLDAFSFVSDAARPLGPAIGPGFHRSPGQGPH